MIACASPKGGAGKSTTSLILGTTLREQGATVSLIDTDVQATCMKWANGSNSIYKDMVTAEIDPDKILQQIVRDSKSHQFVIVDVQGRATMTIARVFSRANLVIIPLQASTPDAQEAAEAMKLVKAEEEYLDRTIKHQMLMTRVKGIPSKEEREIIAALQEAEIPMFKNSLVERVAFSRMHSLQLALSEMSNEMVNGLPAARKNAEEFSAEVVQLVIGG